MKLPFLFLLLLLPILTFPQGIKIVDVFHVKLSNPISLNSNLEAIYKSTLENQTPDFIEEYCNKLKTAEYFNETDLKNKLGKRWVYDKSGNLIKHYDDGFESDSLIRFYDKRGRLTQSKIILYGDSEVSEYFKYKGDTCYHYIVDDLFQKSILERKTYKTNSIEIKWILDSLDLKKKGEITIENHKNETLEKGEVVNDVVNIYSKTIFEKGIPKIFIQFSDGEIYLMNIYKIKN